jgi:hypothetical protein
MSAVRYWRYWRNLTRWQRTNHSAAVTTRKAQP